MKSRKNRIVSLITAAFLLCSVIVPATRGGITARAAGFETESYTVDFKDFDLTNDGKVWSNGGWSIEDDSEAAGGKYLKFSGTSFDWNGRLAIRLIPSRKLKNSSNYRFRIRYRVEGYARAWANARLGLAATHANWGNITEGGDLNLNSVMLIDELSDTAGWIESDFCVKMPDKYAQEGGPQLMLYLFSHDASGNYANGKYGDQFNISFDYIKIDRVSELRLHRVDEDGEVISRIYGAPGEAVKLPEGNTYYSDYDPDKGEFSGEINPASLKFTNDVTADLYYSSSNFENESYMVDFGSYDPKTDGKVYSDAVWSIGEDAALAGGKYLLFERDNFTWPGALNAQLMPKALTAGRSYRVTVRYSVSGYNRPETVNGKLGIALSQTNYGSITDDLTKDIRLIKDEIANTDGYITESFDIKMPDTLNNTASPCLMLYMFSHDSNNKFYSTSSYGKVSVKFDYIKIERTSAVELYSSNKLFKTVGIVPGEVLSTAKLPVPTLSGHDFLGWFTEPECLYSAGEEITGAKKDITAKLYAGWREKEGLTVIHFDTNGGAELADIKGVPGDTAELPVPTNTGSTFSGWFYDRECTRACSTVVFPPTGQSLTLYAGWNIKEPWVKVDFESPAFLESGWWNVNSSYSAKYMTFPEGFAHGGNRSLKFEYAAGAKENTKASLSVVMYKNNNHVTVETGKSYSMTFWYNAEKLSSDVSITAQTCFARNFWASGIVNYDSNSLVIRSTEQGGGWKKATIVFTAEPSSKDRNCLYFRINPLADADTLLWIDDISIDPLSDSTNIITLVYDSLTNEKIFAEKGDEITLPTPKKDGYTFGGWYTDKKYENAVTGSKYKVTATGNLYARWILSSVICDFENYPQEWMSGSGRFSFDSKNGMSITDSEHVSGEKSLHYSYNKEINDCNPYAYAQLYNVNDITVNGDVPLILDENSAYTVKFKYKLKESAGDVRIDFVSAARTNYWGFRSTLASATVSRDDTGGGWFEKTLFFQTGTFTRDEWTQGDAMYMVVNAGGTVTDICIDDIELTGMGDSVFIEFKSPSGDSQFVTGKAGETIKFPADPVRNGYKFTGWYTDKELTQKFEGTVFGKAAITLYPKMVMDDEIKISFEDEYYRRSLKGGQVDTCEISSDMASDGKYSLKLDKADTKRGNTGIVLVAGEAPIEVEDGATYVITYDYYVVKDTGTSLDFYTPWPNAQFAGADNIWAYHSIPDETWRFPLNEQQGIWKTASFMFKAALNDPTANTLYFTVNATAGGIYYFDNLRLSKLDTSDGKKGLNLNPTGATALPEAKLYRAAKAGAAVNLPTDIKREGYEFIGWFADKKCTEKVNDRYVMSELDTTLYAGWAIKSIKQDFETLYDTYVSKYYRENLVMFDYDYELTDKSSHSGKISAHRIGNDYLNAAFQAISADLGCMLSVNQVYKLKMWVKMDSYKQTRGAIRIASSNFINFPWGIDGDWKNVCAIEDLADGQWHELTYTFYSTGNFLSISTPGLCSIYIDEISLELIPGADSSICSSSVEAEEYIGVYPASGNITIAGRPLDSKLFKGLETAVARKDNTASNDDGNGYYDEEENTEDNTANSGKKKRIKVVRKLVGGNSDSGNGYIVWIIAGAAVVLCAAGAAVFIIVKHRKGKEGK